VNPKRDPEPELFFQGSHHGGRIRELVLKYTGIVLGKLFLYLKTNQNGGKVSRLSID
jgi:hypothetical protein